jgi:glycosyltransferase involved in cell wall biosynthesis
VVPPQDSGSLAAAVTALAADPELRVLMGKAGREFAERNYDRVMLAREYHKVLDQAVGTRGDDPPVRARWRALVSGARNVLR